MNNNLITVKGAGHVSLAPDQIEVSITLSAQDKSYEKTVDKAGKKLQQLYQAVKAAGFEADQVKAENVSLQPQYHDTTDAQGSHTRAFCGYQASQQLILKFPLDTERLATLISELSASKAAPQFSVRFSLQDQEKAREELLFNAVANARRRAEVICQGAGMKLGGIVEIRYGVSDADLYSPAGMTFNQVEYAPRMMMAKSLDVHPEAIELSDEVTIVFAMTAG